MDVAQGGSWPCWMAQRKATGHVRECHGDLHLANIVLIDGRVRLFDCIEFNDELRWIDTPPRWPSPTWTCWITACVRSGRLVRRRGAGAQRRPRCRRPLLRFYAVYRAMVRAKVAALRDAQTHAPANPMRTPEALAT